MATKARRIRRRLVSDKHGSNHAEKGKHLTNTRRKEDKRQGNMRSLSPNHEAQFTLKNQGQMHYMENESKFKQTSNVSVSAREILGNHRVAIVRAHKQVRVPITIAPNSSLS